MVTPLTSLQLTSVVIAGAPRVRVRVSQRPPSTQQALNKALEPLWFQGPGACSPYPHTPLPAPLAAPAFSQRRELHSLPGEVAGVSQVQAAGQLALPKVQREGEQRLRGDGPGGHLAPMR